jgi:hypothetical protein
MNEPTRVPGFAPSDPTDGRDVLDWTSRYSDPEARKEINREAAYLGVLLLLVPAGLLALWLEGVRYWLSIPPAKYTAVVKYGVAWLSGTLGGTLFSLKWLYHVVARGLWNIDRRLWRIFTPHISGGLAFAVTALVSSGVFKVFDRSALNSLSMTVGMSFLVGYFSDSAIAKLSELAETLFGSSHAKARRVRAQKKG